MAINETKTFKNVVVMDLGVLFSKFPDLALIPKSAYRYIYTSMVDGKSINRKVRAYTTIQNSGESDKDLILRHAEFCSNLYKNSQTIAMYGDLIAVVTDATDPRHESRYAISYICRDEHTNPEPAF